MLAVFPLTSLFPARAPLPPPASPALQKSTPSKSPISPLRNGSPYQLSSGFCIYRQCEPCLAFNSRSHASPAAPKPKRHAAAGFLPPSRRRTAPTIIPTSTATDKDRETVRKVRLPHALSAAPSIADATTSTFSSNSDTMRSFQISPTICREIGLEDGAENPSFTKRIQRRRRTHIMLSIWTFPASAVPR